MKTLRVPKPSRSRYAKRIHLSHFLRHGSRLYRDGEFRWRFNVYALAGGGEGRLKEYVCTGGLMRPEVGGKRPRSAKRFPLPAAPPSAGETNDAR